MRRLTAVLCVALALCSCGAAWSLTNTVNNPSFEVDTDGDGIADGWSGEIQVSSGARGSFAIDTEVKRSGKAAQRIDHESNNTAWVRVSQEPVAAVPSALYRVSCRVRSEGAYQVLLYEFLTGSEPYTGHSLGSGGRTDGWVEVSQIITTSPQARHFKLSLIAQGPGSVWFDDAMIARVDELPGVKAPRVDTAPTLDGDLTDPVWANAPELTDFLVLQGKGELAGVQTSARLLWDESALYLAFDCEEPNMAGVLATATGEDPHVWSDDCVEVFLNTERDSSGYVHLGVGAGGGVWQERTIGRERYPNWYTWRSAELPVPQWEAAVQRGEDRWTAEVRLPFDELGGTPGPGTVWGLQLCRTRRAGGQEQNSTWSYIDGDKYARPERFGALIYAGGVGNRPQFVARRVDRDSFEPTVIPMPRSLRLAEGAFSIDAETWIAIADESQRPEARWLQADVKGRFGLELPIREGQGGTGCIDLGAAPDRRTPEGEESYRLLVSADGVTLRARSPRARLYGVGTLRQMLASDRGTAFCRCAEVQDSPGLQWRAWHMASPSAADLPTYRKMVDFLALLGYNTIVWEVDGNLQYETHPDIARAGAPTKAELKSLVDYARSRHFRVIPQLAVFSHFGFVLNLPAYQHLAETQQTVKGIRSRFNFCPRHPETYPLVFDLMGELVEVFEPEVFHGGLAESSVDDIGVCELCRDTEPWVIWAESIDKLHEWIGARGMRMAMWGDQFLPQHTGSEPHFTSRSIDRVPRDILIFDWHYSPNHDYDSTIAYFKDRGFEVLGCPWYEPVNVYAFASAAGRNGILGYCGTTWSGVSSTLKRMPHLPAAWVIGGENSWSPERPALEQIGYRPVPQFQRLFSLGEEPVGDTFRLVDIAPLCNEATVDDGSGRSLFGHGADLDLRALPTGVQWIGDVPFQILDPAQTEGKSCLVVASEQSGDRRHPPAIHEIPVGLRAEALYFLHTCDIPEPRERSLYATRNPRIIGEYVINYVDGQSVRVPLEYLANIHDFNGQRGPAQAVGVWEGLSPRGVLLSVAAVKWSNPRPEVSIKSLDFSAARGVDVRSALLGITAG